MEKQISAIQYISNNTPNYSHSEQARLMFENGIDWVQIRMKNNTEQEILNETRLALSYAKEYNATLILNDHVEMAKELGVHGVHLGLNDMPVDEARTILSNNFIIGGTANTFEDCLKQKERGADYIGLGPYRYTSTKKNLSPILGIEGLQKIFHLIEGREKNCPIVVVGGITNDDIISIKDIGYFGVAMSTALLDYVLKKSNFKKTTFQ